VSDGRDYGHGMSAPRRIAVVGASLTGARVLRALRRRGYDGELVLIGDEDELPYDRPPLSKKFLASPEQIAVPRLEPEEFYNDIELRLGTGATALHQADRTVELSDGSLVHAEAVVIASGAVPRSFPTAAGVDGVLQLRTAADARSLRSVIGTGMRVVVLGGGFIGCEVAASARARGADVTIVEALSAPVVRGVGVSVGRAIAERHRRHGVELRLGARVTSVNAPRGRLRSVTLDSGGTIPADCLVVGIGSRPSTSWLQGTGVNIDNGVVCDDHGRVAGGGGALWAAGDAAAWLDPQYGRPRRFEHWTAAVEQASVVAANLLDGASARGYKPLPYVWSDQFDFKIQIVGDIDADDHMTMLYGTAFDDERFAVAYSRAGRLCGVVAVNLPRAIVEMRPLVLASAPLAQAV
jgi:3-phenylpropionate/trans-cinnamate dioxygenase ferredoxin reductase component